MKTLTPNEKKVLYGLACKPVATDQEIAADFDLKRSTVTAIRNRLHAEDLYRIIHIPDFYQLGGEFLSVLHSAYSPLAPYERRKKYAQAVEKLFAYHFGLASDRERVIFTAAKDLTEFRKNVISAEKVYGKQKFLTEAGNTYAFFPFTLTETLRLFDYTPLLRAHFGFSKKSPYRPLIRKKPKDFTGKERQLIYELVRDPMQTDQQLAQRVSVSRQAVNKFKQQAYATGLLLPRLIPNLPALGFELVVFTHFRPTVYATQRVHDETHDAILQNDSLVGLWCGDMDTVYLSVYKNYTEFQTIHTAEIRSLEQRGMLQGDPVVRIFPFKKLAQLNDLNYAQITAKLLGLDVSE